MIDPGEDDVLAWHDPGGGLQLSNST